MTQKQIFEMFELWQKWPASIRAMENLCKNNIHIQHDSKDFMGLTKIFVMCILWPWP